MADYPTNYPNFTDLNGQATLAANNHAARHNKVHAEVSAIAQRVGKTGDTDNTTHEYKLSSVTGVNKAETQGNKSTAIDTSTVSFPTNKAVKDYVDAAVAAAIANMVTTNTTQTISGIKTFSGNDIFSGNNAFNGTSDFTAGLALIAAKSVSNVGGVSPPASRQTIATGSTADASGLSISWTAGTKNELIYVFGNVLATAGPGAEVYLHSPTARIGSSLYKCTATWEMFVGSGFYTVPAGTTVTFNIAGQASGGNIMTLANSSSDSTVTYRPQIGAFLIGTA